jgi:hypothetical protein
VNNTVTIAIQQAPDIIHPTSVLLKAHKHPVMWMAGTRVSRDTCMLCYILLFSISYYINKLWFKKKENFSRVVLLILIKAKLLLFNYHYDYREWTRAAW